LQAGIINAAGTFALSSQAENAIIYHDLFSFGNNFNDITYGTCGLNARDFCTGVW
jgi:hypothetical protein